MNMAQVKPSNQNAPDVARCTADFKGRRLQTRMRLFVAVIVCAYSLFGLALVLSTTASPAWLQARKSPQTDPAAVGSTGTALFSDIQRQSWMWAGLMIGIASLGATFVYSRKLLAPLDDLRLKAARVACGRLDQPAEIREEDETGALAELINDIAANQQEILLHLWNQTGSSIQVIDRLQASINGQFPNDGLAGIKADLASVRNHMENLRALADGVEFFQVQLTNGKIAATKDVGGGARRQANQLESVGSGLTGRR